MSPNVVGAQEKVYTAGHTETQTRVTRSELIHRYTQV